MLFEIDDVIGLVPTFYYGALVPTANPCAVVTRTTGMMKQPAVV